VFSVHSVFPYIQSVLNVLLLNSYFVNDTNFLQVCNAVAVAGYLNATLVIPNFHYHSIWKDPRLVMLSIKFF